MRYRDRFDLSRALELVSSWSCAYFAFNIMMKTGRAVFPLIVIVPMIVCVAVLCFGHLYSRLAAKSLKLDRDDLQIADAFSYTPFFMLVLMGFRGLWQIPNLGAFLLASTVAMSVWIKASTAYCMTKKKKPFNMATYAPPAGFALALVCQMAYSDLNIPRYLIMGQVKTLAVLAIAILAGRLRSG